MLILLALACLPIRGAQAISLPGKHAPTEIRIELKDLKKPAGPQHPSDAVLDAEYARAMRLKGPLRDLVLRDIVALKDLAARAYERRANQPVMDHDRQVRLVEGVILKGGGEESLELFAIVTPDRDMFGHPLRSRETTGVFYPKNPLEERIFGISGSSMGFRELVPVRDFVERDRLVSFFDEGSLIGIYLRNFGLTRVSFKLDPQPEEY